MEIEINPEELSKALLESAAVEGYNADSPTMAEKASSVHRFISNLFNKMMGAKS